MDLIYPLAKRVDSYGRGRSGAFGARRLPARKHAGCDLYGKAGDLVYAMEDGTIERIAPFYKSSVAMEVVSTRDNRVIRYGEVITLKRVGDLMLAGEPVGVIAPIGKQCMLHLEMYSGEKTGSLTDLSNAPTMRRADLLDPTPCLNEAVLIGG